MSQPNRTIRRGLAGIQGLNFAYRLNTWGPKVGPSMLPANAFPKGLASPLTWFEGVFGIESPQDMLTDASNALEDALTPLNGLQSTIQNILAQAQAYDNVTDSAIQAKAQAVEAEAVGHVNTYSNLQTIAQTLINQITIAKSNSALSKEDVTPIQNQISSFKLQVSALVSDTKTLQSHMDSLVKSAQSGPGLGQSLESAAVQSVSTLTWILGGGALVYFLAPTFIPRLALGLRKARR